MTISNLDFYANNVADVREPSADVVPTSPGSFDGEIYSSLDTPVISRVGHVQHVYTQSGQQLILVFRSNIKATLCGLYGFEDMIETRDADGRTITLTWNVPNGEAGVSRHFGARAKTAGGEHEIFTLAHINKVPEDIFFGGIGTSRPTLKSAAENPALTQGCTLVINPGDYSDPDDFIQLGSLGLQHPSGYYNGNLVFPNGVHTVHTVGTEQIINVSKFSCIVALDPLSVKINRHHRGPFALHMQGNDLISPGLPNPNVSGASGYQNDGGRTVRGILFMAFALRGGTATCARVKKSGFIDCSIVDDSTLENPPPDSVLWFGDGAGVYYSGTEDVILEGNHIFPNHRYGVSCFVAHKTAQRKTLVTMGAMQGYEGEIFNAIAYYNDLKHVNYNCWHLDSAEYAMGSVRYPNYLDSGTPNFDNKITMLSRQQPGDLYDSTTIRSYGGNTTVKRLNDQIDMFGHAHLNDIRSSLVHCNGSGRNTLVPDNLENSYGWYTRRVEFDINPGELTDPEQLPCLWGGSIEYNGVTVGRTDDAMVSASAIGPHHDPADQDLRCDITNVAVVSSSWNYQSNFTDTLFYGDGDSSYVRSIAGVLVVDPPANINTAWTLRASNYDAITKGNAHAQGIKYICRVEPKSPLAGDPRPCQDIFRTKGRYLTFWNYGETADPHPDFRTVYENVNWYNRLSVAKVREEHQNFLSLTNGLALDGNKGHAAGATSRADYYQLTYGVTTDDPDNCPYIINIWGYVDGTTAVVTWDGVPPEYRGQATGYNFYINDVLAAENQSLDATEIRFTGLTSGSKEIYMVVVDPVRGNSGPSKPFNLVI